MDPLSALGLISGIVQLADTALKIVNLLDTIKDGGKERRKLCDEIIVLFMTLRNLEIQFTPPPTDKETAWTKPIESLAEPQGVFDQLGASLDEVWEKLTTRDTKRGKIMQTLKWPLDQKDVDRAVARIEHLKTTLIIVLDQTNISIAREIRSGMYYMKKTADDSKFKEIIDWLSPLNFAQKQEAITVAPGTGAWFFESEEFKLWHTDNYRWLWCYGIPGAGKTFIASNTANELRRLYKPDEVLVLSVFCSFDMADSQSIDNLVASLLKQIIQIRMGLPKKLDDLYTKHLTRNTRPKLNEICEILSEAMSRSPKTFIILDALDELTNEPSRMTLLETLFKLDGRPKIMVTSRQIESIANRFGDRNMCDTCEEEDLDAYFHCENCEDFDFCEECRMDKEKGAHATGHVFIKRYGSLSLRIAAQAEDIESYVRRRIEEAEDIAQMVERQPELQTRILDTIVENAKDMCVVCFHCAPRILLTHVQVYPCEISHGFNNRLPYHW